MKGKSKRKPGGKRAKATKKAKDKPPDKSSLEVVKDDPPPDPTPPPADVDVEVTPKPEVRPLNPVEALQYKFAMLQEELVGEKKQIIVLKRAMIGKDEEIVSLRRENANMKETLVSREEQDLFRDNITLLQRLGVSEDEEVLFKNGRLFIAPKGTAQRTNG